MIIDQLLFFLIGIQSLAYQVLRITCILAVAVTSLGSLCCSFGPTQWSLIPIKSRTQAGGDNDVWAA